MAYINGRGAIMALMLVNGGDGNLKKKSTASEMNSILANATAGDVGKAYHYVGETTEAYEKNAIYLIKDNNESFVFEKYSIGDVPTPYDEADEHEKLYEVNFSSGNFVHHNDTAEALPNNGVLYDARGNEIDEAYVSENHKNLLGNHRISEDVSLKIDGNDTNGKADHRYVGRFPMYDLENKTYTYELEYFRNFSSRHKFYFASGTFINRATGNTMQECGCDVKMPNLAIQLANSDGKVRYLLVRQSMILYNNTENIHNNYNQSFVLDDNGEFTAKLKVVLKGGTKKNVTLYANYGEVYNSGVNYWVGDVVPIDFEIYHSVSGNDILISSGSIYQPADIPLVCGVGNYDVLASGGYYGIRNLTIFKGDRAKISEGGATLKEVHTALEMDTILANATNDDIGKAFIYAGESTAKYTNNTIYVIREE